MSRRAAPPVADPGPILERQPPDLDSPDQKPRRWRRPKIDPQTRASIYERDGFACRHCGSQNNLTIDHIVPLSKNGRNHSSNMQTLCADCNQAKGSARANPAGDRSSTRAAIKQQMEDQAQTTTGASVRRVEAALAALGLPPDSASNLPFCRESTSRRPSRPAS